MSILINITRLVNFKSDRSKCHMCDVSYT